MLAALVLILSANFHFADLAHAQPVYDFTSTSSIAAYVRQIQHEYGLDDDFYDTLEYESAGFQNIQSEIIYKGKREESYGIAQIHLPSHDITKEQALDPEWAVRWAAEEFVAKRQWQWTGWRLLKAGHIQPS